MKSMELKGRIENILTLSFTLFLSSLVSCTHTSKIKNPESKDSWTGAVPIHREWFPYKESKQTGRYDRPADFGDGAMNGLVALPNFTLGYFCDRLEYQEYICDIGVFRVENNGWYYLGFWFIPGSLLVVGTALGSYTLYIIRKHDLD